MVDSVAPLLASGILLFAQKQPQTLLTRLQPRERAFVLAALAGLIILGFGLVALVWLGAKVTRRYMNQGNHPRPIPDENDWARKPLIPPEPRRRSPSAEDDP